MTKRLHRITTEYIDTEDRVRLAGEIADGETVVVWLTQRMLSRLVPVLLEWLQKQLETIPRPDLLHSFAQQAARAELTAMDQTPVLIPETVAALEHCWLALSIDVVHNGEGVSLTFIGADKQRVALVLEATPVRQWLGIVYDAYVKADWPTQGWPLWMSEEIVPRSSRGVVLH